LLGKKVLHAAIITLASFSNTP
jgi:hypothetical protein